MNYKDVVDILVNIEGGYDKIYNDPNDSGGKTRAGISSKYYPNLDLEKMSHDDIRDFYKNEWYLKINKIDNTKIKNFLFLSSVNTGFYLYTSFQNAINDLLVMYNKSYKIKVDGILGNNTNIALNDVLEEIDIDDNRQGNKERIFLLFYMKYLSERYSTRKSSEHHFSGWMNRIYRQLKSLNII